jgi:ribokinase
MLFNVGAGGDVRCAVVGHVEVVEFARVDRVPRPGEIIQTRETWIEPAGGGAVAAAALLRIAANVIFFTAFGDDELGHRTEHELRALGLRIECAYRDEPQRRGFTYLDDDGERTITVIGRKLVPHAADPLPWRELDQVDGVYLCGADPGAVREARRARALVATARELATLREAGVQLDALVQSASDASERYRPGDLEPAPRLVVSTSGALGGWVQPGGPYTAAALPAPIEDAYGAGDCFAAGLTYALAKGMEIQDALAFASERGALALTRRGAGLSG